MVMRPEPWGRALDGGPPAGHPAGRAHPGRAAVHPGRGRAVGRRAGAGLRLRPLRGHRPAGGRLGRRGRAGVGGVASATTCWPAGSPPSLVMVEAVTRLLPGVVGNAESVEFDSHADGLLEGPSYTRPASWRGHEVPAGAAVRRPRRDRPLAPRAVAAAHRRPPSRPAGRPARRRADRRRPGRPRRRLADRLPGPSAPPGAGAGPGSGGCCCSAPGWSTRRRRRAQVLYWYTPGGGVEDGEELRHGRRARAGRGDRPGRRPRPRWRGRCGCVAPSRRAAAWPIDNRETYFVLRDVDHEVDVSGQHRAGGARGRAAPLVDAAEIAASTARRSPRASSPTRLPELLRGPWTGPPRIVA